MLLRSRSELNQSRSGCGLNIFNFDFRAGFFDFSFVSISNVLSAWFQYEALKLVNFTTVVLFKGSRILPVMIMGRIISKTKNSAFDWITAVLLCVGSVMFMVSKDINTDNKGYENIISGIVCLILYVTFGLFSQNIKILNFWLYPQND